MSDRVRILRLVFRDILDRLNIMIARLVGVHAGPGRPSRKLPATFVALFTQQVNGIEPVFRLVT